MVAQRFGRPRPAFQFGDARGEGAFERRYFGPDPFSGGGQMFQVFQGQVIVQPGGGQFGQSRLRPLAGLQLVADIANNKGMWYGSGYGWRERINRW